MKEFRRYFPAWPQDPERLKDQAKEQFKSAWETTTPFVRRTWLLAASFEFLAFLDETAWVESSASEILPLAKLKEEAVEVFLEEIPLRALSDPLRPIRVEVLGKEPSKEFLDAIDFSLSGRIALESNDPSLVLFFCLTPEDLDSLTMLTRLGFGPSAEKLARAYPPRAVVKALKDAGPGVPLVLTGRPLLNPRGHPVILFEVWNVELAGGKNR